MEPETKSLSEVEDEELENLLNELQEKLQLCSRCGLCKEICPVFNTLLNEAYSPRGKNILVDSKKIEPKIFYACALCGACEELCPSKLELTTIFRAIRTILVKKGIELKENKEFIENMKKHDVPFDVTKKEQEEFYCC